jgi:hypothetical protein
VRFIYVKRLSLLFIDFGFCDGPRHHLPVWENLVQSFSQNGTFARETGYRWTRFVDMHVGVDANLTLTLGGGPKLLSVENVNRAQDFVRGIAMERRHLEEAQFSYFETAARQEASTLHFLELRNQVKQPIATLLDTLPILLRFRMAGHT